MHSGPAPPAMVPGDLSPAAVIMSEPDAAATERSEPGVRAETTLRSRLGFRSIRAKLTFYLLAVATVPVLFLAFVAFHTAKTELRRETLSHLGGVVSLKRDIIERWYDERRLQVSQLREVPGLEAQAAALIAAPFASRREHEAYRAIDAHLRHYIGPSRFYDEIFLMHPRGQLVYSTNPAQEGKYKDNRPYFEEGLKGLYIQNTYHSITLGRTTSTISLPIRQDQQPVGVLAFRLRIDRLHEVMRSYAGLHAEADMYLVNDYNYFVTDPAGQTDYAMERVNYSEPVRRCLSEHNGSGELESHHGRTVLAAFTFLDDYRLCVIGELATATAYESVRRMQLFIVVLTASTLIGVTLIAFFVSASISWPIRALTGLTARAAAGDLAQNISLARRDELGTLATSFNTMIASLRERTEELARSNADLEQFAYITSHDLKEPLRSVAGFAQLLEKRYRDKLDDRAIDYIHRVVGGTERMRLLIDDLLSYSRVSIGPRTMNRVNLGSAVQEVLGALSTSISESQARVHVGALPVVRGEPRPLSILFQNLIANAIKFRRDEPPVIRINAEEEDGVWHFTVQDNGIGIAPQYSERVFQVFQRLHRQEEYPGTGIGLAVCKKIVERHGGRIWLESEPDAGTTFHFTIPR